MSLPSSQTFQQIKSIARPQGEKKRAESIFFNIICWIFTLFLWIFIYFLKDIFTKKEITKNNFYEYYHKYPIRQKLKILYVIIEVLIYIIYIILEFNSPIFKFLKNKTNEPIKDKMKTFFSQRPIFNLNYEIISKKKKKKINKYAHNFNYYSCRDVSGLFILNSDENIIKKKKYILLELGDEINFDKDNTKKDYNEVKNNFIKKSETKDSIFKIKEKKYIKGLKKYHMIKINDKNFPFVNYIWFCLFTVLVLTEFYKIYIRYICIYQKFIIRKIVSTRIDLSKDEKYDKYNPQLNLITNDIFYESNDYNYLSNNFKKENDYNLQFEEKYYYNNLPDKNIFESESKENIRDCKNSTDLNSTNSHNFPKDNDYEIVNDEKKYTNDE